MRISDAEPGDVLRDKDGFMWKRTKKGAVCALASEMMPSPGFSRWWSDAKFALVDHEFGPFTPLVREPTNAP